MPPLNPSYAIRVTSPARGETTLHLRPYETSPSELSRLLTAYCGAEGQTEPAVALTLEEATMVVFPLVVVSARPDALASCTAPLRVLFATSMTSALLNELLSSGKLKREECELLNAMREDAFVKAAVEVYQAEGDVDDLVDTLQRIAVIKSAKQPRAAPQPHTTATSDDYPAASLRETVRGCLAEDAIKSDDAEALLQLVEKRHPILEAGFKNYEGDGDWSALVRVTAQVAQKFSFSRVVRARLPQDKQQEEVLDLFRNKDARVWAAWDVFVDEQDEADFADTLGRCTRAAASNGARATEAKDVLRRLVIALHVEGRVDDKQGQALRELVESGNEECEALANEYLGSDKSQQDASRLADGVLNVLNAQDELLSDRMKDFVRSNLLSGRDAAKIIGLIDARDERVLDAFDSFYQVMASGGSAEEGQEILQNELGALAKGVDLFGVGEGDVVDVDDDLDEEEEEEDEDDLEDEEVDGPTGSAKRKERRNEQGLQLLFEYIKEWGLSDDELVRLRNMITNKETHVSRALEMFANDQDPEAFKVAMIRAAREESSAA